MSFKDYMQTPFPMFISGGFGSASYLMGANLSSALFACSLVFAITAFSITNDKDDEVRP